jgi:enediyne biosynthesis protein E4
VKQELDLERGVSNLWFSEGAASGDFDNGGRMDILVGNLGEHFSLYRNIAVNSNHRLKLRLHGSPPINRDAIDTLVKLHTSDGKVRMRTLVSGSSHGAGNELALHFGLGSALIERIEFTWPDGATSTMNSVARDQFLEVRYPPAMIFSSGFE